MSTDATWSLSRARDGAQPMTARVAVVIGAMKAGTTTLCRILSRLDGVLPSTPNKEVDYFCPPTLPDQPRSRSEYLSYWPNRTSRRGEVLLDGSVGYAKHWTRDWDIPALMRRFGDRNRIEFRLIYIARDPLDACLSFVRHAHISEVQGLEAWAKGQTEQLTGWSGEEGASVPHPLEVFAYRARLRSFLRFFGPAEFRVMGFEDVVDLQQASPRGERLYRELSEFIGVPAANRLEPSGAENRYADRARALHVSPDSADRLAFSDAQLGALARHFLPDVNYVDWRFGVDTSRWSIWKHVADAPSFHLAISAGLRHLPRAGFTRLLDGAADGLARFRSRRLR